MTSMWLPKSLVDHRLRTDVHHFVFGEKPEKTVEPSSASVNVTDSTLIVPCEPGSFC